jgi:hypothetical protein
VLRIPLPAGAAVNGAVVDSEGHGRDGSDLHGGGGESLKE